MKADIISMSTTFKMNNKYIFDVDGTLTPARQQIDHDFEKYMLDFSDEEDV